MLKDLKKDLLKNITGKHAHAHKALTEALISSVAEQDAHYFDKNTLKIMCDAHWDMSQTRKSGSPQVKVVSYTDKQTGRRKTFIDVVTDDLAFIVDSVAATINKHKCLIELLVHPILDATYDTKGKLIDIKTPDAQGEQRRQSHIHVHIHETLSDEAAKDLEEDLHGAIADVRAANLDWKTMLVRLKEASAHLEVSKTERPAEVVHEYCAFLDYLHDNNFTLLGFAEYRFDKKKTEKVTALGLMRSDDSYTSRIDEKTEGFPLSKQKIEGTIPPLMVAKTEAITTVHRRVPMDIIVVKMYNDAGEIIGEKLFLGLFTSVTYSRSVKDIPYLRMKVKTVIEKSEYEAGSHDGKALRHILEKYPRDELFQTETDTLLGICTKILRLQERQHIALFTRNDVFGNYISCMVYVPRERFGTALRKKIVTLLENELGGTCGSFFTSMDDSLFARGLFRIDVDPTQKIEFDHYQIEEKLQELGQTWAERISYAMEDLNYNEEKISDLSLKYGEAFPVNYTKVHCAKKALFDIDKTEDVLKNNNLQLDLYKTDALQDNQLRLKIYNPERPIVLSDILPILDNMSLRAVSELPYEITPLGETQSVWIHDFLLERPKERAPVTLEHVKTQFEEAFSAVWYNDMESDKLNRLVLSAHMSWRDIVILRTYVKYMRQARVNHSQNYIQETLTKNASLARDLVNLFKTKLDPSIKSTRDKQTKELRTSIKTKLKEVDSLNQDRVIRILESIILATLRTNFYQHLENGEHKDYVSIKLDSKTIDVLPNPKPFREIFVYSTQVEGVHLRGDMIARGGLRWSDRHEDFRTEILGLMKAQMVKNSVIVPMGSKGGFVVKTPTYSRDEFRTAGVECYKTFIRGLLDITDNLESDTVIPPQNTVRIDGDDPYLVVAADKGTATFSDIANGLSQEYGFWLDDAFASGGSAGYDHKKMGITARGAWESVKLHFRQLGHNTQTDEFDVIGVGDMGGDVFGNGMLLSEHIRLIGAFNHLHIFCDPAPNAAKTYKERKRLFDKVAGWDEYDEELLSKGGRIFSRSDKSLTLTPEIKERFNIKEDKLPPEALIKAMLKAQTDLLWFGGIGTYIKSDDETHDDAGDKANDALRIDGKEVGARVIGEGANLGVTQLGRIEFAKYGGRINTDFIDNSGGVDSSDHEVNIKILLSAVMKDKKSTMDLAARNELLESMTKTIEDHVLRHNYQQALAVSLTEKQAAAHLQIHDEFINDMEEEEGLDRRIEFLPNTDEVQKRMIKNLGLTRPELSVLISYAKISLTKKLLKSTIPDEPSMQVWLFDYFPEKLRETYKDYIDSHKLRREIIAMAIANSLINRLGPTFIQATMEKTGMSCDAIVRAYIITREVFDLRNRWTEIESLDNKVQNEAQLQAMIDITQLVEFSINWLLTRQRGDLNADKNVDRYRTDLENLQKQKLATLLSDELTMDLRAKEQQYKDHGFPAKLAASVASLPTLKAIFDISSIARQTNVDLNKIASVYYAIGHRFQLDWLQLQAAQKEISTMWDREATEAIIDKFYRCQAGLTARILVDCDSYECKSGLELQNWEEKHQDLLEQVDPFFKTLRRAGALDLAMLMVAEQRLRHLYGG